MIGGMTSFDARAYAELEVNRLIEIGELKSTDQSVDPLPLNPPSAPAKIIRCVKCACADPCHLDWCDHRTDARDFPAFGPPAPVEREEAKSDKAVSPRYPFLKPKRVLSGYEQLWEDAERLDDLDWRARHGDY